MFSRLGRLRNWILVLALAVVVAGGVTRLRAAADEMGWSRVCKGAIAAVLQDGGAAIAVNYHPWRPGDHLVTEGDAVRLTPHGRVLTMSGADTKARLESVSGHEWVLRVVETQGRYGVIQTSRQGPMQMAVPAPVRGRLALSDEYGEGIWVADALGTSPRLVTSPMDPAFPSLFAGREGACPVWAALPAWSPDGTRIYFVTNRSGGDEVWAVGSDGGNEAPVFSPDQPVALNFRGVAADGRLAIYTLGDLKLVDPDSGQVTSTGIDSSYVSWSPDRTWLMIVDAPDAMWLLGTDGGRAPVESLPSGYPLSAIAGSWSPDGTRFATYAARLGYNDDGGRECLLVVVEVTERATCVATIAPPPGLYFDERVPVAWAGPDHILVAATDDPLYSGLMETWAYCLGGR